MFNYPHYFYNNYLMIYIYKRNSVLEYTKIQSCGVFLENERELSSLAFRLTKTLYLFKKI
jgi:hypothetical protein